MTNKRRAVPGVHPYDGPAGGWGALKATAIAVRTQMDAFEAPATLLRTNQPDGFDCPGCAWPDKEHKSTFQFCENGAKAVTWEATTKRVTPAFLAANTVTSLLAKSDFELEGYGRLTHPLVYDRASDTLRPVAWEQAFARIGEILRGLQPDEVEFYTSGRASNEAAWLFQLYAREYGTNNFPDCSNMCHESTSVGLPQSIGIGKGTVSLDDFDQTELVISIGHNPGTNHPRMMGTLHELSRRGVPIIVFNPLRERALERFADPQNVMEMATRRSTPIASTYYQVRAGGDAAALKGIMKALVDADRAAPGALDHDFIAQHTQGFDAYVQDLETSTVIFAKNENVVRPIASISKLMTAVVVVDANLPMDEMLEITDDDVDGLKHTTSRLRVGTKLSRGDMLHLALMSSENRAANALGRHYPGGLPAFVAAMNAKAQSLGMTSTRFIEPTGLSSDNVSSPHDLARLLRAASQRPLIHRYSTDTEYEVEINNRTQTFRNTNLLVRKPDWDIKVSKTGYINEAGECLVMLARINGRDLAIVLLDSQGKLSRIGDAVRIRRIVQSEVALASIQSGG
ncbi:MAG: D-alanyl-D-alanine endopeptidase [Achromobacter sp.]|nr:D-alanyl-D-alanine endopeptidase [Achromobacter sp.]